MSFTDDLEQILAGTVPSPPRVQLQIAAIKQLIAERLPEYEQYDGSRAKTKKALHEIMGRTTGHNVALNHVKQNLDLTTKENPE